MEPSNEKTKFIDVKFEMEGYGIVNYNGDDQYHKQDDIDDPRPGYKYDDEEYDHRNFAKRKRVGDKQPVIISTSCMRRHIFNDEGINNNQFIVQHSNLLNAHLAHPLNLMKGTMFPDVYKEKIAVNRKSPIEGPFEAVQTNDKETSIVTNARAGKKNTNKDENDNTFFKVEDIGEIEYEAEFRINLESLRYISFDDINGNPDVLEGDFNKFMDFLKFHLGDHIKDMEMGYHMKFSDLLSDRTIHTQFDEFHQVPEKSILLSDEDLKYMVKLLLKRVATLYIGRTNSYAKIKPGSLKVAKINSRLSEYEMDEEKKEEIFETLESEEDIDKFDFDPVNPYVEVDKEKAESFRSGLPQIEEDNEKSKELKEGNKKKDQKGSKSKKQNKTKEDKKK